MSFIMRTTREIICFGKKSNSVTPYRYFIFWNQFSLDKLKEQPGHYFSPTTSFYLWNIIYIIHIISKYKRNNWFQIYTCILQCQTINGKRRALKVHKCHIFRNTTDPIVISSAFCATRQLWHGWLNSVTRGHVILESCATS